MTLIVDEMRVSDKYRWVGSIPIVSSIRVDSLAVEQLTVNQQVAGSIPAPPSNMAS